jgi:DNA-binding transcriptional LysR family regulator
MELRQLQTFLMVAEVQGFTKAAEILGYAQSSVTAQIQSLEEELGVPLFERLGKKVILTKAGERLLPYAQEMLKLHSTAKTLIQTDQEPAGTLVIGAPESLAVYRLPAIIQEYRNMYPQVKFILKPGVCWELRNQVRNGQIDLAFLLEPVAQIPDFYVQPLVKERMVLIAPNDHPLVKKERVSPEEIRNETILFTESGCSYRAIFVQHLQRHGIYPDPTLEFWNLEAIKKCVMCGLGISLLPLIAVENELREGKLSILSWDDTEYNVTTQLVYHKDKWITPAFREFLEFVNRHARNW